MGRTSELISAMTFLGIRHDQKKKYIDLVAWPKEDTEKFQADLEAKLEASRKVNRPTGEVRLSSSVGYYNDDEISVKDYFSTHIKKVTDALSLTALTEVDDQLLIMKGDTEHYVYFGGVTKTLVYISCWMVVPQDHETNADSIPKLLFWFLNTLYVGQLQGLEDTAVDANMIERQIDLKSIPVYINK